MKNDKTPSETKKRAKKLRQWSPSPLIYLAVPEAELFRVPDGRRKAAEASFLADIETFAENWWIGLENRKRSGWLRIQCNTTFPKIPIADEVFGQFKGRLKQAFDRAIQADTDLEQIGKADLITDYGHCSFKVSFGSFSPDRDYRLHLLRDDDKASHEGGLIPPLALPIKKEHNKSEIANDSLQEHCLIDSTGRLCADLTQQLRTLIPEQSTDAEEMAQALLALNRTLNQTIRGALRNEINRLIDSLLRDTPSDYEGKRGRAALINNLFTTFNLAIQIRDDDGRTHICGMQAVRGRSTDEKGTLRLLERTRSGSSQKSYPIPSPAQREVIDTSHQDSDERIQSRGNGRSG